MKYSMELLGMMEWNEGGMEWSDNSLHFLCIFFPFHPSFLHRSTKQMNRTEVGITFHSIIRLISWEWWEDLKTAANLVKTAPTFYNLSFIICFSKLVTWFCSFNLWLVDYSRMILHFKFQRCSSSPTSSLRLFLYTFEINWWGFECFVVKQMRIYSAIR